MLNAMTLAIPTHQSVTGVILAGGQARRMGGEDKGLIPFAGRPLVEWVIEALAAQVSALIISANRNAERYARYGYPVVSDLTGGFQGPLAGLLASMRAARTDWIMTLPCDGPHPPSDLLERLATALMHEDRSLSVATDGARLQLVHALLPVTLADDLRDFLDTGERKVERWYARHRLALADFSDRPECFVNLNTPEDWQRLELNSVRICTH